MHTVEAVTVPRAIVACIVLALAVALPASAGARADVRVRVTIAPESTGSGSVTGSGINCPGDCTEFVPEGSTVLLTGTPEQGSALTWGGACAGTDPAAQCALTPTSFTQVSALFTSVGPGPGGDKTAPRTEITKAPKRKVKTRKSKARVTFEFDASEKGSTFECRLDDKPFENCSSPLKLKAPLGKHTFDVRATDKAENTDDSPARAAFKVVKKKRR